MKNNKQKKDYLKLNNIKINGNRVDYYFTVSQNLEKFFDSRFHMFIDYDENIENIPISILAIPFVSNIMPLMWITDSILWIEEIDRTYYDSLLRVKNAYQNMYDNYRLKGSIISAKTINNQYKIKRSALELFSGGLDAIATNIRIIDKNPLLVNIYGWDTDSKDDDRVFQSDKINIKKFSLKNNLDAKFIKSNFATFINSKVIDKKYKKKLNDSWWHGFQHGMSFIGHAIPLAYKYNIENIFIASSFSLGGERHTCSSDPAVDIEIKYASGGVIHDGCELTRQDKIRLVVEKQKQINSDYPIRVCSFNDKNCCKCEKCFRTILGLIAEGVDKSTLEKFGFYIDDDLTVFFNKLMDEKIHLFGVEREQEIHWPSIKRRMIDNKENITETKFVDWFLNYNFIDTRKKAILKYRVENCIFILKRKMLFRE